MTYDEPYELDDPKHPTWSERQADRADEQRKKDREEPPEPTSDTLTSR